MYYYKQTERGEHPLWTVGINDDDGRFQPESDHDSKEEAAKRVRYLNGGEMPAELKEAPGQLTKRERFAMAAMQALLTRFDNPEKIVVDAVRMADELISRLNKKPKKRK